LFHLVHAQGSRVARIPPGIVRHRRIKLTIEFSLLKYDPYALYTATAVGTSSNAPHTYT